MKENKDVENKCILCLGTKLWKKFIKGSDIYITVDCPCSKSK